MKALKHVLALFVVSGLFSFAVAAEIQETKSYPDESINNLDPGDQDDSDLDLLMRIIELNSARIGDSKQIMLVTNEQINKTGVYIQTFEKVNGEWVEKFEGVIGTIGRSGFAPYNEKVEGDGKSPTGIFFLGPVYTYPDMDVQTKMEHWKATENDYWIDDGNSPQYNRWVVSDVDPKEKNVSNERMKRDDHLYRYGICVQYNMDQVVGKGSVITVHVIRAENPTAGCVAVPQTDLLDIIGWLDPAMKPLIIMGSEEELGTSKVSEDALTENDKYVWKKEKWIAPSK